MTDEYPVDFDEPVGRVRKYIPDLIQLPDPADPDGPKSFIFSDEELQSFISDEATDASNPQSWEIKRAAAYAMIALGNSENLILKKIVTQDQQTDGPSVAKAYIAAAAALLARADAEIAVAQPVSVENLFAYYPPQTRSYGPYHRSRLY